MRLPHCLWTWLEDFCMRKHTGKVILYVHEGVIVKYELTQVQKVSRQWTPQSLTRTMLGIYDETEEDTTHHP